MKKLIVIAGVVLITYLILMTTLSQPTSAPSADKAATEQSVSESEYRIGALDGKVAVFRYGDLYLKTDTAIASLPKADRSRIEEGIDIDSLKELKRRLEDYCS